MVCADTRMNRWSLGNLRFVRIVPRLLALFQTGDRPVLFTNSSKFRSSLREVPVSKSLHETRTCKFLPTWRPPLFYYFGGIVSTFGSFKINARFAILIGIIIIQQSSFLFRMDIGILFLLYQKFNFIFSISWNFLVSILQFDLIRFFFQDRCNFKNSYGWPCSKFVIEAREPRLPRFLVIIRGWWERTKGSRQRGPPLVAS